MNILIIFTHPSRASLNGALLDKSIKGLTSRPDKPDIRVLDLYKTGFDPVLHFGKDKRRRDMHLDSETAPYRELLLWAQKIVFIYPIWWGRPPAMLLGFIDRIFASNFAYKDIDGSLLPEGLLKGREVVCISTMKGPQGYLQFWLWNSHRVLMKKALFQFVGMKKVKFFELGDMEGGGVIRAKALNKIQNFFKIKAFA